MSTSTSSASARASVVGLGLGSAGARPGPAPPWRREGDGDGDAGSGPATGGLAADVQRPSLSGGWRRTRTVTKPQRGRHDRRRVRRSGVQPNLTSGSHRSDGLANGAGRRWGEDGEPLPAPSSLRPPAPRPAPSPALPSDPVVTQVEAGSTPARVEQRAGQAAGGRLLTARGRRTRAALVDGAKAVFAETPFVDTRIADITARAGVANGTFYTYFDSKEEIFREVAADVLAAMLAAPRRDPDNVDHDPIRDVEHASRAVLPGRRRQRGRRPVDRAAGHRRPRGGSAPGTARSSAPSSRPSGGSAACSARASATTSTRGRRRWRCRR